MQKGKTAQEIQDKWEKLLKTFFCDLMTDIQQHLPSPLPTHAIRVLALTLPPKQVQSNQENLMLLVQPPF